MRGALWRHGDFLRLWTGQTVSEFGSQFSLLAVPLTAVLLLKASTFSVGLLTTFEMLPFLLFGLPAGVWVDRMRRRSVLVVGDLGRAVAMAWIPVGYALGALRMWQLYAVVLVTGILTVFFDVAYQSYLAPLVGREHLIEGNAKLEVTRSAAQIGGPGVAGALLQVVRAPLAVVIDAASFLFSATMVLLIRRREPRVERNPERSMVGELWEGLGYVLRHRWLRAIAACTGSSNLFGNMLMSIYFVYAVRTLGMSPGTIGLVLALGNAGWLCGALAAGPVARRIGTGRAIVAFVAVGGLGNLAVPLAQPRTAVALLLVAGFVVGFGAVGYNINQVSLRQAITPDRLQGRMNASMRFLVWGTMPIGSFAGAVLGSTMGVRPTLWIAAIGGVFPVLPVLLSPVHRVRSIAEAVEEESHRSGAPASVTA